jgi:hypothetical protein
MNYNVVLFCTLLQLGTIFSLKAQSFDGYALYNAQNSNTAYLIDKDANIAYSWSCPAPANYAIALKDNGNIVRGVRYPSNALNGAAIGGMVHEIDSNNQVVWEFVYSSTTYCSHHDICLMPNGNVLLIAWEVKSISELTQAGFANANTSRWPTHIVEVQQNGTGGQIIWEWHMWDHMIQDHDPSKLNYGVVANHPELMDVNSVSFGGGPGGGGGPSGGDWFHVNGLDYNPQLDQIVFSSRFLSEIFIIDHSTTTAEAAGHTGGNAGKGGDFLYRWGNPSNYGVNVNQTIASAVHDPRWIPAGRPNAGYIQFFNNVGGSGGSSVVDAINPPLNGYNYTLQPGQAYGPSSEDWRHSCIVSHNGQSASDRMTNGNTFVNVSNQYMYEVDSNGTQVWAYPEGPAKAFRYECSHPGITALLGNNPCGLTTSTDELSAQNLSIVPNPTRGKLYIEGLNALDNTWWVYDTRGQLVLHKSNCLEVDLSDKASGIYFLMVQEGKNKPISKKIHLIR